jgi:hypothetical protein
VPLARPSQTHPSPTRMRPSNGSAPNGEESAVGAWVPSPFGLQQTDSLGFGAHVFRQPLVAAPSNTAVGPQLVSMSGGSVGNATGTPNVPSWGAARSAASLLSASPPPPVGHCSYVPGQGSVPLPLPAHRLSVPSEPPTSGTRSPAHPQPFSHTVAMPLAAPSRQCTPKRPSGCLGIGGGSATSSIGVGNTTSSNGRCSPVNRRRAATPTSIDPRPCVGGSSMQMLHQRSDAYLQHTSSSRQQQCGAKAGGPTMSLGMDASRKAAMVWRRM